MSFATVAAKVTCEELYEGFEKESLALAIETKGKETAAAKATHCGFCELVWESNKG